MINLALTCPDIYEKGLNFFLSEIKLLELCSYSNCRRDFSCGSVHTGSDSCFNSFRKLSQHFTFGEPKESFTTRRKEYGTSLLFIQKTRHLVVPMHSSGFLLEWPEYFFWHCWFFNENVGKNCVKIPVINPSQQKIALL